jgi:hypothetical protein
LFNVVVIVTGRAMANPGTVSAVVIARVARIDFIFKLQQ